MDSTRRLLTWVRHDVRGSSSFPGMSTNLGGDTSAVKAGSAPVSSMSTAFTQPASRLLKRNAAKTVPSRIYRISELDFLALAARSWSFSHESVRSIPSGYAGLEHLPGLLNSGCPSAGRIPWICSKKRPCLHTFVASQKNPCLPVRWMNFVSPGSRCPPTLYSHLNNLRRGSVPPRLLASLSLRGSPFWSSVSLSPLGSTE